jgi:hypothetical protein
MLHDHTNDGNARAALAARHVARLGAVAGAQRHGDNAHVRMGGRGNGKGPSEE